MPTGKPRHTITETDDIREDLDRAKSQFPPQTSRTMLVRELVLLGGETLDRRAADDAEQAAERRRKLAELADLSATLDFEALDEVGYIGLERP